jgi:hypothetical protein
MGRPYSVPSPPATVTSVPADICEIEVLVLPLFTANLSCVLVVGEHVELSGHAENQRLLAVYHADARGRLQVGSKGFDPAVLDPHGTHGAPRVAVKNADVGR